VRRTSQAETEKARWTSQTQKPKNQRKKKGSSSEKEKRRGVFDKGQLKTEIWGALSPLGREACRGGWGYNAQNRQKNKSVKLGLTKDKKRRKRAFGQGSRGVWFVLAKKK